MNSDLDDEERTPLHLAAGTGRAGVCVSLLGQGARVNARDDEENTPLHLAAAGGHTAVFDPLLAAGAEVRQ